MQEQHPHTAEYKGKKPWRFTVDSDFIRKATGTNGKRLSAPARTLYLIIQSYVGPTSPVPFPKVSTIAHWMDVGLDTLRRYMKELTDGGWLRVEQRRQGWNKFDSNAFILLDGDEEPCMENPRTAQARTPDLRTVEPSTAEARTKSTQCDQEAPVRKSDQISRSEKRRSSSNTADADAAAAAEASPSAPTGADAPEPPSPASKAETFIQNFRAWSEKAGMSSSIVPRERQAVINFFSDNPKFTVRELTAIQINAWCMPSTQEQDSKHQIFWHCNLKSKRIKTFIEFLPAIQDELDWDGSEKRIDRSYRKAEEIFLQRAAA